MREIYRIKQLTYTDSDVLAFYMKYRESNIGPFIREVGDFIAHSKRDRGATLETTAYMFAQMAFFQTYQGDKKIPFNPDGPCGWWLKPYFLGKLKETPAREIKKATGLSIKEAMREVEKWFPKGVFYPTSIKCTNLSVLWGLVDIFSRYIRGVSAFNRDTVENELLKAFKKEGIPKSEIPHFLIATSVLLSGKSCEIVPGFVANIKMSIDQPRHEELTHLPIPDGATYKLVKILPDGNLKVAISTTNSTGDGLVSVGLDLIDTKIDTEAFFDRRLIKSDEHNFEKLDLSRQLAFERSSSPMVFPID